MPSTCAYIHICQISSTDPKTWQQRRESGSGRRLAHPQLQDLEFAARIVDESVRFRQKQFCRHLFWKYASFCQHRELCWSYPVEPIEIEEIQNDIVHPCKQIPLREYEQPVWPEHQYWLSVPERNPQSVVWQCRELEQPHRQQQCCSRRSVQTSTAWIDKH